MPRDDIEDLGPEDLLWVPILSGTLISIEALYGIMHIIFYRGHATFKQGSVKRFSPARWLLHSFSVMYIVKEWG